MLVRDVKLHSPRRTSPTELKKLGSVVGLDTETLGEGAQKPGYAFLVCTSEGDSYWIREFEDLLSIIISGDRYVCYNMNFDAQAMLKWFGVEFNTMLLRSDVMINFGGIDVLYVPGKFLSFTAEGVTTKIWDASQFVREGWHHIPLAIAGPKFVGMAKKNFPVKDLDESYYGNQGLVEYCIHDAKIVGAIGNLLIKEYESMGVPVTTLASPAAIAEVYCLDLCRTWIPDITKIEDEAIQYAEDAVQPPLRVYFKRGYWESAYNYDINSAFPSKMLNLVDLSDGVWTYFKGDVPQECTHAYIKCELDVPRSYLSWVLVKDTLGGNFAPYGRFTKTLTLHGLRRLPKGTKVRIIDGWAFNPWNIKYSYREATLKLLALRANSPGGSFRRELAKGLTSSLHGKFRQTLPNKHTGAPEMGRMFMPAYEAEVMTDVTTQVYAVAAQIPPEYLIGIHTDCIYVSTDLDMPLSDKPGEWGHRGRTPFLVVGLTHTEKAGKGGWVYTHIEAAPEADECYDYFNPRQAPISMGEAIAREKFEDACVFKLSEKKIHLLRQCFSRFWPEPPTRGGDLISGRIYDSEMLPVGVIDVA